MSDRIMKSEGNPVMGEKPNPSQHPLANYQFSPDEIRVLKECNTESFFQRCLPLGTLIGVSTYYGVRQGYLTPNAKYGAVPKVVVGVIIGYFLGKFSYQNKCAEKMMQLPNSKLGQLLRQKRQGNKFYNTLPQQALGPSFGLPSFGSSSSDVYSDEGLRNSYKGSSLDLDTERSPVKELDDIYKPNLDNSNMIFNDPTPSEPAKPSVSYDELRRRNRENYLKPKNAPEKPLQYSNQPIITGKPEEPEPPKNKYGDTWSS